MRRISIIGWLCTIVGAAAMLWAMTFNVGVAAYGGPGNGFLGNVSNTGLMSDRETLVIVGAAVFVAGVMLLAVQSMLDAIMAQNKDAFRAIPLTPDQKAAGMEIPTCSSPAASRIGRIRTWTAAPDVQE